MTESFIGIRVRERDISMSVGGGKIPTAGPFHGIPEEFPKRFVKYEWLKKKSLWRDSLGYFTYHLLVAKEVVDTETSLIA